MHSIYCTMIAVQCFWGDGTSLTEKGGSFMLLLCMFTHCMLVSVFVCMSVYCVRTYYIGWCVCGGSCAHWPSSLLTYVCPFDTMHKMMPVKTIIMYVLVSMDMWICTLRLRSPCYLGCASSHYVKRMRVPMGEKDWRTIARIAWMYMQRIMCERCIIIIIRIVVVIMSCGHLSSFFIVCIYKVWLRVSPVVQSAFRVRARCGHQTQSLFLKARIRLTVDAFGTRQNRMVFTPHTHNK